MHLQRPRLRHTPDIKEKYDYGQLPKLAGRNSPTAQIDIGNFTHAHIPGPALADRTEMADGPTQQTIYDHDGRERYMGDRFDVSRLSVGAIAEVARPAVGRVGGRGGLNIRGADIFRCNRIPRAHWAVTGCVGIRHQFFDGSNWEICPTDLTGNRPPYAPREKRYRAQRYKWLYRQDLRPR